MGIYLFFGVVTTAKLFFIGRLAFLIRSALIVDRRNINCRVFFILRYDNFADPSSVLGHVSNHLIGYLVDVFGGAFHSDVGDHTELNDAFLVEFFEYLQVWIIFIREERVIKHVGEPVTNFF